MSSNGVGDQEPTGECHGHHRALRYRALPVPVGLRPPSKQLSTQTHGWPFHLPASVRLERSREKQSHRRLEATPTREPRRSNVRASEIRPENHCDSTEELRRFDLEIMEFQPEKHDPISQGSLGGGDTVPRVRHGFSRVREL